MDLSPYDRLTSLGLQLPLVSPPKGTYVPAVRAGQIVYISGQIPMKDGKVVATGRIGEGISVDQGRALARQCALAALAAIDVVAGLTNVTRIATVTGYVASADGVTEQASVVDGASELLVAVLGEAGRHARSVVGVARLPLNAPMEIEMIAEVQT
ncbi:RidA family protein [Actinomadura graeca]|uniref:RidA family protein n=1 Tax=Actinomadura graeca TaxID=2750812 RepID=A0ABX8QYW1_9ACTN|nr:RidA family protein [Actinomadura graeca]QXJ23808.1 RidA family protein [Actinomadura graeca]